jgi:Flp pilus assembly protein TadG
MRQLLAGLLRHMAAKGGRGTVSVEFALVSLFVLLPLFAGGADFVLIMSAEAQLKTALQALNYYAWTNPSTATNMTNAGYIISLINQQSDFQVTLPTNLSTGGVNGGVSYACFTPPASASTTISAPQSATCASTQTQQTLVTYQVTTSVYLPAPMLGFSSPYNLSATATVQIH